MVIKILGQYGKTLYFFLMYYIQPKLKQPLHSTLIYAFTLQTSVRLYLRYCVEEKGATIYRALTILSPPTLIHLILTITL